MKYPFNSKAQSTQEWFGITNERADELSTQVLEMLSQEGKRVGDMMEEVMHTLPQTFNEMLFCLFMIGVDNGKSLVMRQINEQVENTIKDIKKDIELHHSKEKGEMGSSYMDVHKKKVIN